MDRRKTEGLKQLPPLAVGFDSRWVALGTTNALIDLVAGEKSPPEYRLFRRLKSNQLLGGFVIRVSATEDRSGIQIVASDSEGGSFFESAINVFDAMNPPCNGEAILGLFLRAMVDHIVDREAEWAAGDLQECEQQDRSIAACVAALQLLRQNVFRDNAIKKAKEFIDANKST